MSNVQELLKACRIGDKERLKSILLESPQAINESDSKLGWTGLYCSVMCGHTEIAKYLISNSADINVQNRMGETPLHQAIECRNMKLIKLLLKSGANPNVQQNDGETPLHLAISQLNFKAVSILLQYKADPNIPNFLYGKTPTHYAVESGNSRIYNEILNNNADLTIKDKQGYSAESLLKGAERLNANQELSITQQISPILTRCNSESSTLNEKKSIDSKLKQIQMMHQKIRETVRTSVDTIKKIELSQSSLMENDEYKPVKTAPTELNPELYNWLKSIRLSEEYEVLVAAGYDDLPQMVKQMKSSMPITEKFLIRIGMKKVGHRRRLLMHLTALSNKHEETGIMGSIHCCIAITQGFWSNNFQSLSVWLKEIKLGELEPILKQAGFEEVEDLIMLDETQWKLDDNTLASIGIEKPGYRHRILAKLREKDEERKSSELVIEKNGNNVACASCYIM